MTLALITGLESDPSPFPPCFPHSSEMDIKILLYSKHWVRSKGCEVTKTWPWPLEVHNHVKETQRREPGALSGVGRWERKCVFPEGTRCLEDWGELVEKQVAPLQEEGGCALKGRGPWLRDQPGAQSGRSVLLRGTGR